MRTNPFRPRSNGRRFGMSRKSSPAPCVILLVCPAGRSTGTDGSAPKQSPEEGYAICSLVDRVDTDSPCPVVRPFSGSPRYRKVLSWRSDDPAPVHSAHHDSSRTGMQNEGSGERGHSQIQRRLLIRHSHRGLASVSGLVRMSHSHRHPLRISDPDAASRNIRADMLHGDLTIAQSKAEQRAQVLLGP